MGVKSILRIKSTGELCVDEGSNLVSGILTKHVNIVDKNYYPTGVTLNVNPDDLETYLFWDGSSYVPPA
jgi:hypothetical protein